VYIASPNAVHLEQALRVVEAGKHALVEKPAVLTAADFAAVTAAAAQHGVIVLEAMRNAYDPALSAIADLGAQLGAIRRASFAYCQRSARYDKVLAGERVNIFDPALGGGALYDLGVYCISAMVSMFGEPARVIGQAVPGSRVAPDGCGAALAHYDGLVVDLSYSKITASARGGEIQGEEDLDSTAQEPRWPGGDADGTVTEHGHGPRNNMVHEIVRFAELIRRRWGRRSRPHAESCGFEAIGITGRPLDLAQCLSAPAGARLAGRSSDQMGSGRPAQRVGLEQRLEHRRIVRLRRTCMPPSTLMICPVT
jgi:predicted dehydrogenase